MINATTVHPTLTPDKAGDYIVLLIVTDSLGAASVPANVTISATNRAPVANPGNVIVQEDTATNLVLSAADPENDPIAYIIVSAPQHGILSNGSGGSRLYSPAANFNGPDSFTFKANDGKLDSNIATVSVTVTPVNHPPILAPIGNKTVNESVLLQFSISASDPDLGDKLTYTAAGLPTGATLNANNGLFSWTPGYDQAGTYAVKFSVTDLASAAASETITITVVNVNRPPIANAGNNQTAPTGIPVRLNGSSSWDPDGNSLTYSWTLTTKPSGSAASLASASTATPSFVPDKPGTYIATLIVKDSLEALDIKILARTVWKVVACVGISHPGEATMPPFE